MEAVEDVPPWGLEDRAGDAADVVVVVVVVLLPEVALDVRLGS